MALVGLEDILAAFFATLLKLLEELRAECTALDDIRRSCEYCGGNSDTRLRICDELSQTNKVSSGQLLSQLEACAAGPGDLSSGGGKPVNNFGRAEFVSLEA